MAELSREDMAVLNTLVYIDSELWNVNGKKLSDIVNELKKDYNWGAGSGMSYGEYESIFRAVENNPSLGQLEVVYDKELDYKKYSDARILTLKNGNSPVVVFHGTAGGDSKEGVDNVYGALPTETVYQKGALKYIEDFHDKYGYENISVTGHSKGGNKAMYVSVLSDYVTDCTAFDGQGFSPAFLAKYSQQIQNKKNNITLIAADRSRVNACLYPIAGTIEYLSTDGLSVGGAKLGPFKFHKPNVLFTVDENGQIHFRPKSDRTVVPELVNIFTEGLSALLSVPQTGAVFLEKIATDVVNWCTGDAPAVSVEMGNVLGNMFPGMANSASDIFTLTKNISSSCSDMDLSTFLGEKMTLLSDELASYMIKNLIIPAISSLGGAAGIAAFAETVIKVVIAVVVVYAIVKLLEFVIPKLINAGIEIAKVVGLAVGMAASWIGEQLVNIGKAVVDGFHKAIDGTVQLGKMAVDAAKAVKDVLSNAVRSFLSDAGKFFENIGKGAKNWINGVFGSTGSAIQYAQNINVTMSRIEEMQRHISNLRQCYTNARGTTNNASSMVNRVQSYYNESYVRSCCRDIQNNLKKAQNYINSAERELDRKRKILLTAAESYRNADQEAVKIARSYN